MLLDIDLAPAEIGLTRMTWSRIRTLATPWRYAARGSLLLSAFVLLTDWVLQPLHAKGWLQPLLAQLNSIAWIASFPGQLFIRMTGIRAALSPPHQVSFSAWWVMWFVNFILWTIGLRMLMGILLPRRANASPAAKPGASVPDLSSPDSSPVEEDPAAEAGGLAEAHAEQPTRRDFLVTGARVTAACALAAGGYSVMLETRWFEVTRRTHLIRGLRPELAGLRIVQLTDIHHGPALTLRFVREVVAAANALEPDLVLLTGDYVHKSAAYIEPVVRELSELRGNVGVVATLGNHDWWEGPDLTRECFTAAGIPMVDNDRLFVTPDRKIVRAPVDAGLCVAGVGDLMEDRIRIADALRDVPAEMPRLLLSHNPDVAEIKRMRDARPRVDLMFAGHTHGGQVRLPGLGTPILPSRFGQKYASGLVHGPLFPVYVSRGIGTTILPLRFRVPPEIALIELQPA